MQLAASMCTIASSCHTTRPSLSVLCCAVLMLCRGMVTVVILIIFYTAPLSVLAEVFATRSSASLYLPFAVMNMVRIFS